MHKNKLLELQNYSKRPTDIGAKLKQPLVTQPTQSSPTQDDYAYSKQLIKKLNNIVEQIGQHRKDYGKITKSSGEKEIISRVAEAVKNGNLIMNQIQKLCLKIDKQYRQQQKKGDTSNMIQRVDVIRKANNSIKDYKESQQKFANTVRQTVKRQATIIQRKQINQQQVDELVHNPQKAQQMLKQKMLNIPSSQLQNAVSDIIDKCRDIIKLEKSMHQCLQMMKELALLTQIQGQQINVIEIAIQTAQNYVDDGGQKLIKAKQYHKKSQKKICCIVMLVLLLLGIVLIPILLTKVF